jgi:hypothetical protein
MGEDGEKTSDVSLTCSTIVKNNSPRSEIFHNNETLLDENARSVAFSEEAHEEVQSICMRKRSRADKSKMPERSFMIDDFLVRPDGNGRWKLLAIVVDVKFNSSVNFESSSKPEK